MLFSSLIGDSPALAEAAAGVRVIQAPESSDAVARIQQALICIGFELPKSGVDGVCMSLIRPRSRPTACSWSDAGCWPAMFTAIPCSGSSASAGRC